MVLSSDVVAHTCWVPALVPSWNRHEAKPFASVVANRGVTEARVSARALNVTGTPGCGLLRRSVTFTTSGSGSVAPARSVWLFPEYAAMWNCKASSEGVSSHENCASAASANEAARANARMNKVRFIAASLVVNPFERDGRRSSESGEKAPFHQSITMIPSFRP